MKRSTKAREALDREALEQLLLASRPVSPPPEQAAAIKARVLEAVRKERAEPARDYVTVRSDTGAWLDFLPQVQLKVLYSDGRYSSILLRMAPGSAIPAHFHEDDEECVVLEGEVRIGEVRVKAGDYHLAPKGSRHGELRSDTGAVLFLRTTKFSRRTTGDATHP